MGPPGELSTGRPSPPPTPGRHFSPDRTRAPEGSAPATRREPERSTAGRRPEREQGGRGATTPPPAPPPARQPRGPRPPPPEAGGMDPPRPRGEPERDPPPRPSRRLKSGPRRTSGATPAHRDATQIVPREAGWARTGVVWEATPRTDSTTPVTPALLPAQGKRRATSRGRECRDNKRGGKPAAPRPANH